MRIVCRPGLSVERVVYRSKLSVERVFKDFFLESFRSQFLYIISPWVSNFGFSKPLVYYPFVSSSSIADVLKALLDANVDVRLVTRCVDDLISVDVIELLTRLKTGVGGDSELKRYLAERIDEIISRLEGVRTFLEILGPDRVRFDLGPGEGGWYRLHSKLYVNGNKALVGSANLTKGGITDRGNWECIVEVSRGESQVYDDSLKYAKEYFSSIGKDVEVCMKRVRSMLRFLSESVSKWAGAVGVVNLSDVSDVIKLLEFVRTSYLV